MPSAPKWLFDAVDFLTPKIPPVKISNVIYLSPSVKQISLDSDFSKLTFSVGAFFDFRVSDTDARRYTIADINEEKTVIKLIVHLHGKGVGSDYMHQLKVGDELVLNKPRTEQKYYDKNAEKTVFFGDETSLGLAISYLSQLEKDHNKAYQFIFELDDENKFLPELLGLKNSVIYPKSGLFSNSEWIKELSIFKTKNWKDAYYVLTGNVKSVQTFRKVLKTETQAKVKHHGYWLDRKKGL